MKVALLACSVLFCLATDLAQSADTKVDVTWTTKTFAVKKSRVGLAKGDAVFQSPKGQNGEATASKASQQAQIAGEGKQLNVGRVGTSQVVQAKAKGGPKIDGKSATGDQSKATNPNDGTRTGDAGKWHGELKNKKVGTDQQVGLSNSNSNQNLQTSMHGQGESFDAAGSKGHKYNVDPAPGQSTAGGKGTMTMDGKKHNYQESQSAKGDANAQMDHVGKADSTWTCTGTKQAGISECVDQNGKSVGQVVEQPDGTVLVKKYVAKGVLVPFGKATVRKDPSTGKSSAVINDGMFQGQAGNYKEKDCMADYGKTGGSKVKIEKPFTMKANSESKDGRQVFTFPDCIEFGGKITLPPGVDANRIALQFDCSILPAGKLKCVDPGACNKDCYYCNLCNNTRKVDILQNSNGNQMCNAKGGGTYQVSVTACPPPETQNKAQCSGMTKADASYWKKKGDIDCKVLIWERPVNEQQLRNDYYNNVNGNNAAKMILKTQYTIANKQFINANNPTDFDLCEFYIKTKSKGDELIACHQGTTNYTLSSQKVRTDFLLEAGTLAAAPKSLVDTKPCPAVDAVNQAQANQDAAEAKKNAPAKTGWAAAASSFFGGR